MYDVYNIYLIKRNNNSVKYIVISYNAKVGNAMSILRLNIHGEKLYIICSLFLLLQETLKFTCALVGTLEEVLLSAFEGRGLRPVSRIKL